MNTLLPALELLCKEGMKRTEPVKLQRALKEIRRDSRRYKWSDDTIETLPTEWQWRVCTARIQLGYLDWRGWQWRNPRSGMDNFDFPKWDLGLPLYPYESSCKEPEKVGKLLVYGEQGVGDEVMFAQTFNEVLPYADEVIVECEPRLEDIFSRSFPKLKFHGRKDLRDADWIDHADAKVLMGELVARFRRSKGSFLPGGYLIPDKEKVAYWKTWLEENVEKPWVGYSWAGRQGFLDFSKEGWINLQYGDWEIPEGLVTPPIDLKEDLEDVFAIVFNLDKVVSVANTLVHMAGSLNVKTECILTPGEGQVNNAINYRFGMGNKILWHPSVDVYRNPGQWKNR